MPYISKNRREVFEDEIQSILDKIGTSPPPWNCPESRDDKAKGEFNYIMFSLIARYLLEHGEMRYHRIQDFIGTLGACQHELSRRLMDVYEDKCIEKNGDVDVLGLL